MHSINQKIQQIMNKYSKKRRYRALAAVLSLAVVFSVCGSLIMPAISMTGMPMVVNTAASAIETAYDFTDKITSVTVDGGKYNGNDGNDKMETVKFKLAYENLPYSEVNVDHPYIKYKLELPVEVPESGFPSSMPKDGTIIDGEIWGPVYDGSRSGYYHIYPDGTILIKFDDSYLKDHDKQNINGTVSFDANVLRGDDNTDNEVKFDMGNINVTVPGFPPKVFSAQKSGTLNNDDKTIEWSVTVNNALLDDLGGYTITDTMFGDNMVGGVTVDPADAGSYDAETKTFTFNDGVKNKTVTLKYTTKLTDDQLITPGGVYNGNDGYQYPYSNNNVTNTATLNKNDGTNPTDMTANVSYNLGFKTSKSVSFDYDKEEANWKIEIENNDGISLKDFVVTDKMIGSDTEISISPDGVTVDKVDGGLKVTSDTKDKKIVITYSTPVEDGETYTNAAQLKNPKDVPVTNPSTASGTYSVINLDKWGGINDATRLNDWTIEIKSNTGKKFDFNNYYVIDDMIPYAENLKVVNIDTWGEISSDYYSIDENGKITFKIPEGGDETALTCGSIRITYSTDPFDTDNPNVEYDESNDKYKSTNTAYVGIGDKASIRNDTQVIDAQKLNNISKNCLDDKVEIDKENGKAYIPWQIELEQEDGIYNAEFFIKDYTKVNDENGGDHWIDEKTFTDGKIAYEYFDRSTNNWVTSPYTLPVVKDTDEENLSGFKVDIGSVDVSEEDHIKLLKSTGKIRVTVYTVADISEVPVGETWKFENDAEFSNGKSSKDVWEYENVDTSNAPFQKYDMSVSLDKQEANGTTTKNPSALTKVTRTIDGAEDEYYKFDYRIVSNADKTYKSSYTLIDTFPDGFILDPETEVKCKAYNQDYTNSDPWDLAVSFSNSYSAIYCQLLDNNRKMSIRVNNDSHYGMRFDYSLLVKVSEFDKLLEENNGKMKIVNSVQDEEQVYQPTTQTQSVEKSVLDKSSTDKDLGAGYIDYTVDVNPSGANLSDDDKITLVDTLTTGSCTVDGVTYTALDKGDLNVALSKISVNVINPDGTLGRGLTSSEFNYILNTSPETTKAGSLIDGFTSTDNGWHWYTKGKLVPGAPATIYVKGTPNSSTAFHLKYGGVDILKSENVGNINFDSDGNAALTFTVPSNVSTAESEFEFAPWNVAATSVYIDNTYENREYAAKLILNVPDEMPLRITYQYYATRPSGESSKDYVNAINSVSVNTQTTSSTSTNEAIFKIKDNDQATSSAGDIMKIEKVDVANYNIKLRASFNIYRWAWDSEKGEGSWEVATELKQKTNSEGAATNDYIPTWTAVSGNPTPATIVTDKETGLYSIELTQGVLYKIVETEAPDGYEKLTNARYFVHGTTPDNSVLEAAAKNEPAAANYKLVPVNKQLEIQNARAIDITVNKQWDDSLDHSKDSVTLQLYRSHTQSSTIPSEKDREKVGEPVTINMADNSWTNTWKKLLTGSDDGLPWYYYVEEVSCTVADTSVTYKPYYIGNGKNSDPNKPIEVHNASMLTVSKVWHDANNNDVKNPPVSEISYNLYRSTVAPTDPNRVDDSNGVPQGAEIVKHSDAYTDPEYPDNTEFVLKAGSWSDKLSLAAQNAEGEIYYYYAVELTDIEGYSTSINNGITSTGQMTITNKSTEVIESGVTLPETGGIGTMPYFLAGGAMIFGGMVYYYINKRRFKNVAGNKKL